MMRQVSRIRRSKLKLNLPLGLRGPVVYKYQTTGNEDQVQMRHNRFERTQQLKFRVNLDSREVTGRRR